jgi:hypothetical protein
VGHIINKPIALSNENTSHQVHNNEKDHSPRRHNGMKVGSAVARPSGGGPTPGMPLKVPVAFCVGTITLTHA